MAATIAKSEKSEHYVPSDRIPTSYEKVFQKKRKSELYSASDSNFLKIKMSILWKMKRIE